MKTFSELVNSLQEEKSNLIESKISAVDSSILTPTSTKADAVALTANPLGIFGGLVTRDGRLTKPMNKRDLTRSIWSQNAQAAAESFYDNLDDYWSDMLYSRNSAAYDQTIYDAKQTINKSRQSRPYTELEYKGEVEDLDNPYNRGQRAGNVDDLEGSSQFHQLPREMPYQPSGPMHYYPQRPPVDDPGLFPDDPYDSYPPGIETDQFSPMQFPNPMNRRETDPMQPNIPPVVLPPSLQPPIGMPGNPNQGPPQLKPMNRRETYPGPYNKSTRSSRRQELLNPMNRRQTYPPVQDIKPIKFPDDVIPGQQLDKPVSVPAPQDNPYQYFLDPRSPENMKPYGHPRPHVDPDVDPDTPGHQVPGLPQWLTPPEGPSHQQKVDKLQQLIDILRRDGEPEDVQRDIGYPPLMTPGNVEGLPSYVDGEPTGVPQPRHPYNKLIPGNLDGSPLHPEDLEPGGPLDKWWHNKFRQDRQQVQQQQLEDLQQELIPLLQQNPELYQPWMMQGFDDRSQAGFDDNRAPDDQFKPQLPKWTDPPMGPEKPKGPGRLPLSPSILPRDDSGNPQGPRDFDHGLRDPMDNDPTLPPVTPQDKLDWLDYLEDFYDYYGKPPRNQRSQDGRGDINQPINWYDLQDPSEVPDGVMVDKPNVSVPGIQPADPPVPVPGPFVQQDGGGDEDDGGDEDPISITPSLYPYRPRPQPGPVIDTDDDEEGGDDDDDTGEGDSSSEFDTGAYTKEPYRPKADLQTGIFTDPDDDDDDDDDGGTGFDTGDYTKLTPKVDLQIGVFTDTDDDDEDEGYRPDIYPKGITYGMPPEHAKHYSGFLNKMGWMNEAKVSRAWRDAGMPAGDARSSDDKPLMKWLTDLEKELKKKGKSYDDVDADNAIQMYYRKKRPNAAARELTK